MAIGKGGCKMKKSTKKRIQYLEDFVKKKLTKSEIIENAKTASVFASSFLVDLYEKFPEEIWFRLCKLAEESGEDNPLAILTPPHPIKSDWEFKETLANGALQWVCMEVESEMKREGKL